MRRVGLLLAALAAAAWLLAGVRLGFTEAGRAAAPAAARHKAYSRTVAEGVRYRAAAHPGFDLFAFKSCRMEKRRRGPLTFGGFNVLVVDGLVLNLPAVPADIESADVESGGGMAAEGFAEALARSQGLAPGRFSGLRIHGLTVNRCVSNRVECVFSAGQAESGMGQGGLSLQGCVVHAPDGSLARVSQARLVLGPKPALVYRQDGAEQRVGL